MSKTSIRDLLFTNLPQNGKFYTVAVDGRGGSGKSTFAKYLKSLLPDFDFVYYDDYFEPSKDKEVWGSFNKTRFKNDVINPLKMGGEFTYRPYDWHKNPNISERSIRIKKGVCIEGCFSFGFELPWDMKIWVDTPRELCLQRGVGRDQGNMGYEKALHAWRDIWLPPEDEYIHKIKPLKSADIVIDGTKPFEEQIT